MDQGEEASIIKDLLAPWREGDTSPAVNVPEEKPSPTPYPKKPNAEAPIPAEENAPPKAEGKTVSFSSHGGHGWDILPAESAPISMLNTLSPRIDSLSIEVEQPHPFQIHIARSFVKIPAATQTGGIPAPPFTVLDLNSTEAFVGSLFTDPSVLMPLSKAQNALVQFNLSTVINTLNTAPDFANAVLMVQFSLPEMLFLSYNNPTIQTLGSDTYVQYADTQNLNSSSFIPSLFAINGLSLVETNNTPSDYTSLNSLFHVDANAVVNPNSQGMVAIDAISYVVPASYFINPNMASVQDTLSTTIAAFYTILNIAPAPLANYLYASGISGSDSNYTIQLTSAELNGATFTAIDTLTQAITVDPSVSGLSSIRFIEPYDESEGQTLSLYSIERLNDTLQIQSMLNDVGVMDNDGSERFSQTLTLPAVSGGYQLSPLSIAAGWQLNGNTLSQTLALGTLSDRKNLFEHIFPFSTLSSQIGIAYSNTDPTAIQNIYDAIETAVIHGRLQLSDLYNADGSITMFDSSFGATPLSGFDTTGAFQTLFENAGGNFTLFSNVTPDAQAQLLQQLFYLSPVTPALLQTQKFALDSLMITEGMHYNVVTQTTSTETLQDPYTYDNPSNNQSTQIITQGVTETDPIGYNWTQVNNSSTSTDSLNIDQAVSVIQALTPTEQANAVIRFEVRSLDLNSVFNYLNLYQQAQTNAPDNNDFYLTVGSSTLRQIDPTSLQELGVLYFSLTGSALQTYLSDYAAGNADINANFFASQNMKFQLFPQYSIDGGMHYFYSDIGNMSYQAVGFLVPTAALPDALFNITYGFGNENLASLRETEAANYRNQLMTYSVSTDNTGFDTLSIQVRFSFQNFAQAEYVNLALPILTSGYEFTILNDGDDGNSGWQIVNGHLVENVAWRDDENSNALFDQTLILGKAAIADGTRANFLTGESTPDLFYIAAYNINSSFRNTDITDSSQNTPHVILPTASDDLNTLGTNGDDVFLLLDTPTTLPQPIGNDTFFGGSGADTLILNCSTGDANFFAGAGNDTITLMSSAGLIPDFIYGGSGNDTITLTATYNNNVYIDGGPGNDTIISQSTLSTGSIYIADGDGTDTITAEYGPTTYFLMGSGSDTYTFNLNNNPTIQQWILMPAWHQSGDVDQVILDSTARSIGNNTDTLIVSLEELYAQLNTEGILSSQIQYRWLQAGNNIDFQISTDSGASYGTYFVLSDTQNALITGDAPDVIDTLSDCMPENWVVVDPSTDATYPYNGGEFVSSSVMITYQKEGALFQIDLTENLNAFNAGDPTDQYLMIQFSLPNEIFLNYDNTGTYNLGSDLYLSESHVNLMNNQDGFNIPSLSSVNGLSGDNYSSGTSYFHIDSRTEINTNTALTNSMVAIDKIAYVIPAADLLSVSADTYATLLANLQSQGIILPLENYLYASGIIGSDSDYQMDLISVTLNSATFTALDTVTKNIQVDPAATTLTSSPKDTLYLIRQNDMLEINTDPVRLYMLLATQDADGSESFIETVTFPTLDGGNQYQLSPFSTNQGWSLSGNTATKTVGLASLADRRALFEQIFPLGDNSNAASLYSQITLAYFDGDNGVPSQTISDFYEVIESAMVHGRLPLDDLYNPDGLTTMFDTAFGGTPLLGFDTTGSFSALFTAAGGDIDAFTAADPDTQSSLMQALFSLQRQNDSTSVIVQAPQFALDSLVMAEGASYSVSIQISDIENLQDPDTYNNNHNDQLVINQTLTSDETSIGYNSFAADSTSQTNGSLVIDEAVSVINDLAPADQSNAQLLFEIRSLDLNTLSYFSDLLGQASNGTFYIESSDAPGAALSGLTLETSSLQELGRFYFSLSGSDLSTFLSGYTPNSTLLNAAFVADNTMTFQMFPLYSIDNGVSYFYSDMQQKAGGYFAVGSPIVPAAALPDMLFNVDYGFGNESLSSQRETAIGTYRNNLVNSTVGTDNGAETLNIHLRFAYQSTTQGAHVALTLPTLESGYAFTILNDGDNGHSNWQLQGNQLTEEVNARSDGRVNGVFDQTIILGKVSTSTQAPANFLPGETTPDLFYIASYNTDSNFGNTDITDPTQNTPNVILPSATDDLSTLGTNGDDVFLLLDTATTILQPVGHDTFFAGSAADSFTLNTPNGNANFFGGAGNDVITLETSAAGTDVIYGGSGNDAITIEATYANTAYIDAGSGNDTIINASSTSLGLFIADGAGDDTITLNAISPAQFLMGSGNDVYTFTIDDSTASQCLQLFPAWHDNGDLDQIILDASARTIGNDTEVLTIGLSELYYHLGLTSTDVSGALVDNGNGTLNFNVTVLSGTPTPYFVISDPSHPLGAGDISNIVVNA